MDELGIELTNELTGLNPSTQSLTPGNKNKTPVAAGAGASAAANDADADLEARLEALRRQ